MTKYALLSVSDKTGIVDFARGLSDRGYTLLSTGGTYKALQEAGIKNLQEVADFTGFPEGLDGRIKTLTPQIFGGILSLRDNPEHRSFCAENALSMIDLVVVNLYPFRQTCADAGATFEEKVEKIDIGGPSMLRAAAKNYMFCAPVIDPEDYDLLLAELSRGDITPETRQYLARKVFELTAFYDLHIARLWAQQTPQTRLRYGENPHQNAVVLRDPENSGLSLLNAHIVQGKPLSYNNLQDANAALELAAAFPDTPFAAVIKHATPCGAAIDVESIEEAFNKAYNADPVSAFGGIIALNRPVTADLARAITSFFNEVILAPDITSEAKEIFAEKPNLRVLAVPDFFERTPDITLRKIRGGLLVQDADTHTVKPENLACVTQNTPTDAQRLDMLFGWELVRAVKSNAICIVKDGVLLGKGGGQTSRVEAVEIALNHAGDRAKGAVLASDAFFPFPDSIDLAEKAGIAAIIQPGGAKKDEEVFAACDSAGIICCVTGVRAFLH